MKHKPHLWILPLACLALLPLPAYAYVGPGAGLSAIGSVFAVIAAVFMGVVGFVWYPIKRLLKRGSKTPPPPPQAKE